MDLAAYSYGGAAVAYTVLVLVTRSAGVQPSSSPVPAAFRAAAAASAAWGWAGLVGEIAGFGPAWRATVASLDALRYGLWFVFLGGVVLARQTAAKRSSVAFGLIGSVLVAGLLVQSAIAWSSGTGATPASRLGILNWLAMPVFGLVLLEQLFRNVPDDFRWHANPLCLGLASVFVFDLFLYSQAVLFGAVDADAARVRGVVHALAVPLLLIAARRHATWLGKLHVSRRAAFHTATLLLVGVYLVFMSAVGFYVREFGGDWGRALQVGLVAVALVALATLLLSGTLRSRLKIFVAKNFFTYRYDYRAEWLRFTETLSGRGSAAEIGGSIVRGLANMLGTPSGALWSTAPGAHELVQTARWNAPAVGHRLGVDDAFCRFLLRTGWIVDLDELRSAPQRYGGIEVPAWLLDGPQFWLVVPLVIEDQLIGMVVLSRPKEPMVVNWEVRDLLKTASRQAAGFLARMQATEALLEIRKFDAFNRMSAFVVHDLKNIVTQLSLMLSNARRLQDNPEFRQDMLETVANSLEKMRQLIAQLREGDARPGTPSGVDLVPIVRRLEHASSQGGRKLRLEVVEPVATRGHEERIARVLGHLVSNAFDATPPGGDVWLRLERAGGQARIVVGDAGHGMSPEFVHTQLFKPFRTTKPHGMGIGAYESFQYVHELGGSISVDSAVDRGTVVTVSLPAFELHRQSDLQLSGAK